jgi:PKD repeat protein
LKKLLIVATALLLLTVSAACNRGSSEDTVTLTKTASDQNWVAPNVPSITITKAGSSAESGGVGIDYSSLPEDRMIVRTGNMSIVVNDINDTLASIAQMAESYGGYVVSSNSWKDGERIYGSISIRVPADSYDTASASISQMAVEVTSQSTSSQDVTEEYVDLGARLSTFQATEQQLLAIMAKAEKIEDILAVQAQLTSIRSQIEQIKGRMQYLEKTSATSLITISLSQAKLKASFTASSVNAKTGDDLYFYPDVAGGFTPYSYEWDFGDGNTSTESNPTHTYAKPGTYTVSLKVTDDRGNTVTETREAYIKITQGGWSAGGIASGAWNALVWLGRGLLTILIGLAIFSPVWIVIGVIIWLVRRKKAKAS